ncbi:MAG TPA: hypothetical protein VJ962_08660 [Clostridia bacterium]|nr:hypothetical protein [Clostridia bacterium]
MFNKKPKYLVRSIKGKNRYIVDYLRSKVSIRKDMLALMSGFENAFVMYDSNISETELRIVHKQLDEITYFLKKQDIPYEIIKYKVEIKRNILKQILTSRKGEDAYSYMISFVLEEEFFPKIVDLHLKYNSNLRFGLNFTNDNEIQSRKDYISNMINDDNRFDYYDIDLFYNHQLKRLALFSHDEQKVIELIDKIKES